MLIKCVADDYTPFNNVWSHPQGGLHAYLVRFLSSNDSTFQHIAVWTLVQLLESGDEQMYSNVKAAEDLMLPIRNLATTSVDTDSVISSERLGSDLEDELAGKQEIVVLSQKITELLDNGPSQGGHDSDGA